MSEPQTIEQMLGDLLAVIHRDGGHFQEKHGTEKAFEVAVESVAWLLRDSDELMEIRKQRVHDAKCSVCDGLGYSVGVDRRHVCQECMGSGQAFILGDGSLPRGRAMK